MENMLLCHVSNYLSDTPVVKEILDKNQMVYLTGSNFVRGGRILKSFTPI